MPQAPIPQPRNLLTLLLVAFVALALGAAAFLMTRELSGGSPHAVADLGPRPPENPSVSAPWPDFSNKVLHWQNYSYSFDPASPDHSNGQEIRGEVWVEVGPTNKPVATRATFFHSDGSFHQEYLYADGRGIVVYDEPILYPDSGPQRDPCRQETDLDAVAFGQLVDTGEPIFVDRTKLSAEGLESVRGPSTDIPSLQPADVGAVAEDVIGNAGEPAEVWAEESPAEAGSTRVDILELDSDGRLAGESHSERLASGEQILRQRFISTPVEIFAMGRTLESIFDPSTMREGCGA